MNDSYDYNRLHANGVKDVTYLGAAVTTGWTNCNTCHEAGNVAVHAIPFGDGHKAAALASIAATSRRNDGTSLATSGAEIAGRTQLTNQALHNSCISSCDCPRTQSV